MIRLAFPSFCALSLTACFDLPDVDSDECGNGVLERGEDCDSALAFAPGGGCGAPEGDNEELACRFYCSEPEGVSCPSGWRCGDDQICRQPSGKFEDPTSWSLPADQFAIGDVDGDGRDDLIGNDDNAITVRFGEGDGDFDSSFEFGIRRPTGPVVYGRLGSDPLLDAVVPIEDGLFVLRGDTSRTLQPVTYTPFTTGSVDASFFAIENHNPIYPFTQVLFMTHEYGVMSFINCNCEVDGVPGSCDACEEDLPPGDAPMGKPIAANLDLDPTEEFVLYREADDVLYVYDTDGVPETNDSPATINPFLKQSIVLPEGWTLAQQTPVFAQFDGASGVDLIMQVTLSSDPDMPYVAVSYNEAGTLGPPELVDTFDITNDDDELLFRAMPLAADDYNDDGLDDYVIQIGLVRALPGLGAGMPPGGILPLMFANGVLWGDAVFGDFNADGALDFAVASIDDVGLVNLEGVDIYVQPPSGPPNRFHIDSARPPRQLITGGALRSMVTGDFDGDLVEDLAFVGQAAIEMNETVSVVFGARDAGFQDAVDMGRLSVIQHVFPVNLPISLASLDSISDLFIESVSAVVKGDGEFEEQEGISIMLGDSSRRMVSPLVLSTALLNPGPPLAAHMPRRAVLGDFNEDGTNDIVAMGVGPEYDDWDSPVAVDEDGNTVSSIWFLPVGFDDSTLVDEPGEPKRHPIARKIRNAGELALACSTWAAVDLHQQGGASDAHPSAELVGLDDVAECRDGAGNDGIANLVVVELFPLDDEPCQVGSYPVCTSVTPLGDALAYPEAMSAGDMNSNGSLDAAVLFRGTAEVTIPDPGGEGEGAGGDGAAPDSSIEQQAGVGILWNQEGELEGDDYDTVATIAPPIALASIWLDVNEARDLAILTEVGVFQARFDEESSTFAEVAETLVGGGFGAPTAMATGDLNGDGIDDLAVVDGDTVYVFIQKPKDPLGNADDGGDSGAKDDPASDPVQPEDR